MQIDAVAALPAGLTMEHLVAVANTTAATQRAGDAERTGPSHRRYSRDDQLALFCALNAEARALKR
jgi:hypothetical protein